MGHRLPLAYTIAGNEQPHFLHLVAPGITDVLSVMFNSGHTEQMLVLRSTISLNSGDRFLLDTIDLM